MTNSDPDSDSGHQNLTCPDDASHHSASNGLLQDAYGGARPKTRTTGGRSAGSGRTRHKYREWEEERLNTSPTSSRRRRRVHRTNSSDSVFMIPGQKHKSTRSNALLTERNSYEDWTENQNNMDTSDPEIQLLNSRVTERVPPLPDNLVSSVDNKVVNASNSSLSLAEYRSEDPSDLDNLDILEDDCYIYTYRGGTAYLSADLPNSFFRLDSGSDGESLPGVSGAGQSNLSTGVAALLQDQLMSGQNRSSSPEEPDFLELDFDPGSDKSDLSSEDSGQGGEDEDMVHNSVSETSSPPPPPSQPRARLPDSTAFQSDPPVQAPLANPHLPQEPSLSPRRSESRQPSESSGREDRASASPDLVVSHQPNTLNIAAEMVVVRPVVNHELAHNAVNNNEEVTDRYCNSCDRPKKQDTPDGLTGERSKQVGVTARSVPLVSPVTDSPVNCMPRSKSLNNSISCQLTDNTNLDENVLLCGNRLLLREALLFGRGTVDIHEAVSRLTLNNSSQAMETPRSMIWSHKDACRKHVTQLSGQNSSLAAICNALTALNINISEQELSKSVKVRSKQEKGGICEYLLSCSEAGFNHSDLISEIKNICGDRIVARFFPMHKRLFNLNEWLADWISRGCVPVATLNLQNGEAMANYCPTDAWVNRMIWGVTGKDIFLTNPLEVLTDSCLVPQLDSASELQIRREEIVDRFNENTDLTSLLSADRGFNSRWREMNVLGQVVNVLRENTLLSDQQLDSTSITASVRIPALVMSGVTIFCDSLDAETAALLLATAELPTRLHTQDSQQ